MAKATVFFMLYIINCRSTVVYWSPT